jgi:hypothetical protein
MLARAPAWRHFYPLEALNGNVGTGFLAPHPRRIRLQTVIILLLIACGQVPVGGREKSPLLEGRVGSVAEGRPQ